jgi:hypothetical protein
MPDEAAGVELSARKRAVAARAAFRSTATAIAGNIAGTRALKEFAPGQKLCEFAAWFEAAAADDNLLVAVVGPDEVDCADEVLAYALAWQGNRELLLAFPEDLVGLTLARLSRIRTPVQVFVYGTDVNPRSTTTLTVAEALAQAATLPLRSTGEHSLSSEQARSVRALRQSADQHWALVPAHRSSYLAWHCLGRQVLQIAGRGKGVQIVAGVDYSSKLPVGEESAEKLLVAEQLTSVQRAHIESRVATAVWKRFAGHDGGHVEHRMQAVLAGTKLRSLGLSDYAREYPAWRGEGRKGLIDFLGIGFDNALHVVETKVGIGDVGGVLQTLDYATWVTAHAAELRVKQGWPPADSSDLEAVVLDFIFAPKAFGEKAIGPYTYGQLGALAEDVPWRTSIVTDPLAPVLEISEPLSRSIPPAGALVSVPVGS